MEFAVINGATSAAKTVAITLTNEETRNPANAFAALLNMGGVRFNAEHSLSQAEGQWLRAQTRREPDAPAKPKTDDDAPAKDKAATDKTSGESDDKVAAAGKTEAEADETAANDNAGTAAAPAQPSEHTAAVGLEAIQAVAIQFQILVQLPNGSLQDMGTFDLKALLAAASQDAALASALEAAFGQAGEQLAQGQSLMAGLAPALTPDTGAAVDPAQIAAGAAADTAETGAIAALFKQIAAAFRPLARESAAATPQATQANPAAGAAAEAAAATASTIQTPEAAAQSAELAKILGGEDKIRIQVAVDGRKVADLPFEWSSFNRYVGYSAEAMRTVSTANGQAGQGQASNAVVMAAEGATPPVAAHANAGPQSGGGQAQTGGNAPPREMPTLRAPDAPAPSTTTSSNSAAGQSQPASFASALAQTGGNTAAQQTAGSERPAPTQGQQIVEQIKVHITRAAKAGLDRVTIQLRPEELGRIEIKLEMTQDGQVRANVTADNPATLELLQREARGLERALQDAGLRADANDLEFNLRSQDNNRLTENGERRDANAGGRAPHEGADGDGPEAESDIYDYALAARLRGGIDTYA